jgi:hypothetical protein
MDLRSSSPSGCTPKRKFTACAGERRNDWGLPEPAVGRTPWPHAWSSLVQHYCRGTDGVDVTFDAGIALWFASHEATHAASGIRHRPVTTRTTEAGLAPVIYVIECLKPEMGRAVHLPVGPSLFPTCRTCVLLMRDTRLRGKPPAVRNSARVCRGIFPCERLPEFRHCSCYSRGSVCRRNGRPDEVLGKLSLPGPARGLSVLLAIGFESRAVCLSTSAS